MLGCQYFRLSINSLTIAKLHPLSSCVKNDLGGAWVCHWTLILDLGFLFYGMKHFCVFSYKCFLSNHTIHPHSREAKPEQGPLLMTARTGQQSMVNI